MSVKVVDLTPAFKSLNRTQTSLALRFMVDDIARISNPVTPKRFGNLRSDISRQVIGTTGRITWVKEYAIYQELKQFRNYTTPGTGPHFAEKSVMTVVGNQEDYFKKAKLI
jgi:hypothetical protein